MLTNLTYMHTLNTVKTNVGIPNIRARAALCSYSCT